VSNTHDNIDLYGHLMEIIKWRTDAVMKTLVLVRTKNHYLDNAVVAEFCLLQLRLCCELLAIGCIAVHKDVPQSKRLHKMWNADAIMQKFHELKPRFFPHPVRSEKHPDDKWAQQNVQGALTKPELLKMYHFFGGLLHSGTFETYASRQRQTYDFKLIEEFLDKLLKLLNEHVNYLNDGEVMVRVIMSNADQGGRVSWNVLEKMSNDSAVRQ
jgi:hypothetical protein